MSNSNTANRRSAGQNGGCIDAGAGLERTVILPTPAGNPRRDGATIRACSRGALTRTEVLAERARSLGSGRSRIIAAAAARLQSGALASDDVIAETARRIAAAGPLAG